jgi:transposase
MPAKYVRPYSKGQKNDFRDAEAITEAVQRPTMKFVATKTAEQLDLQALHRVRERLVSQRVQTSSKKLSIASRNLGHAGSNECGTWFSDSSATNLAFGINVAMRRPS